MSSAVPANLPVRRASDGFGGSAHVRTAGPRSWMAKAGAGVSDWRLLARYVRGVGGASGEGAGAAPYKLREQYVHRGFAVVEARSSGRVANLEMAMTRLLEALIEPVGRKAVAAFRRP